MEAMKPTLTPEKVCQLADHMFEKHNTLLGLWQTLADNFYPERADFRFTRNTGAELADSTVDSFPIIARRDLGNSFHAMLRDGQWYELAAGPDVTLDHDGKLWLEWATKRQRRVMDDRMSGFERAVKNGDMDFATFGNAVISIEPNRAYNGITYRNWHLRNVAWQEDERGQVETVARRWSPTLHELVRTFGLDALPAKLKKKYEKTPFETTQVYHVVMPADLTHNEMFVGKYKYVSYFIHSEEKQLIEEKGINYKYYVVPRFQTIAGSPYAYSPATVVALPDSRTLQAMTYTLLEAAERYARPPIVATQKVVTGVVDLRPNGITWVDNEYDERLGAALRSLDQNKGGYPIGSTERSRIYETLNHAFYLDTLSLPLGDKEMTAFEVQERMKQYRRQNLPLFAPMEKDYNGQICETTFELIMQMGGFGSPQDIPRSLGGQDVEFKYKSPLTSDEEEEKANRFSQTAQLLAQAAEFDQGVVDNVDFDQALRDSIEGLKAPISWLRPFEEISQIREARLAQTAAREIAAVESETGAAA